MFQIIETWQKSGQSQGKFCREHKHSISTFQYWLKKYRKELPKPQLQKKPITTSKGFLPVEISNPDDLSSCKEGTYDIFYPNGVRLSCSANVSTGVLQTLINL